MKKVIRVKGFNYKNKTLLYSKIYCKGLNILIAITKSESERVREVFPHAEIVRTCI